MWKKGRGKLGLFQPLLGEWSHAGKSEMGSIICTRRFEPVLDRKFVQLYAHWQIGEPSSGKTYSEICMFGPGDEGALCFWSFTSDGKRSNGWISEAADIHPNAICFEANMPAGRARQTFWPHPEVGLFWAVESKTKKSWNRFVEHHYKPV